MNGLWMLAAIGLVVSGVGGSLWLDHALRRAEAEADDFHRRLATIPDLEPRPGAETGAAPPSLPGGCAGLGVRAIRPRTVAGPVRVDCPI